MTNGVKDNSDMKGDSSVKGKPDTSRPAAADSRDARGSAAWFVKQPKSDIRDAATAVLSDGTISVHHVFPGSSNLFKSDGVHTFVNRNANFAAWPLRIEGDFSVEATIRVTGRNKVSSTSGIGLGMFDSFDTDAAYAFMLLTTSLTANLQYTDGPGSVRAGGTGRNYEAGQAVRVSFRRAGQRVYWNMNPVQEAQEGENPSGNAPPNTEQGADLSSFWKGNEPVFAGISFGNVDAEVSNFTVRDSVGRVLWDSETGVLEEMQNASMTVDRSSLEIPVHGPAETVRALALALGGRAAAVSVQVSENGASWTGSSGSGDSPIDTPHADISVDNYAFPSRITITPKAPGAFTLRVVNGADKKQAAVIPVCVISYQSADNYGHIGPEKAYPAQGEKTAYCDGPLFLEFDAPPVLNPGHSIKIFTADGTLADSIAFAGETVQSGERTLNVGDQLVRAEGNRLVFQPHTGALKPETAYFIAIPTTAVSGTLNGKPFTGFTDNPQAAAWHFTTRAAPILHAAQPVTVNPYAGRPAIATANVGHAQTAAITANFRSLQAALDALESALPDSTDVVIHLAPGIYHEPISYSGGKNITIRGPAGNNRGDTCEIRWRNSNVMNGSNAGRASFNVSGSNLRLENLTLVNTWVRKPNADNQAETLYFAEAPDTRNLLAVRNCSFKSNQDTLQIAGRAWFYDCYIEGNTDFIWGYADTALFERCFLRCVNDGRDPDTLLMVARTPIHTAAENEAESGDSPGTGKTARRKTWVGKGFVLKDSTVSVDEGAVAWFGRNAGGSGFYDQVALVNVRFSGAGKLGSTLWHESAYYYHLGDASRVGWKSAHCTGLGAETEADQHDEASRHRLPGTADLTGSPDLAAEYGSANQILNRVVELGPAVGSSTDESGSIAAHFADAPEKWDLSELEKEYGLF